MDSIPPFDKEAYEAMKKKARRKPSYWYMAFKGWVFGYCIEGPHIAPELDENGEEHWIEEDERVGGWWPWGKGMRL